MSKIKFNRGERQKPVTPEYVKNWDNIFGKKSDDTPTDKGDNNAKLSD